MRFFCSKTAISSAAFWRSRAEIGRPKRRLWADRFSADLLEGFIVLVKILQEHLRSPAEPCKGGLRDTIHRQCAILASRDRIYPRR